MVVDLTKKEVAHLREALQCQIESLRQFTGRSIEADIQELILIREKLWLIC